MNQIYLNKMKSIIYYNIKKIKRNKLFYNKINFKIIK